MLLVVVLVEGLFFLGLTWELQVVTVLVVLFLVLKGNLFILSSHSLVAGCSSSIFWPLEMKCEHRLYPLGLPTMFC